MAFQNPMSRAKSASMGSLFSLQFPRSVRVYNEYDDAQKAVDYLSDHEFAVQNLCIVGTDLKSVERVLGRRSWKTVITQGVTSGISMALFFALLAFLFFPAGEFLPLLLVALAAGVGISVLLNVITYAASGGKRDFTSVSQTVATKYEILCEHKLAQQARDMLDEMPGERARAFEA